MNQSRLIQTLLVRNQYSYRVKVLTAVNPQHEDREKAALDMVVERKREGCEGVKRQQGDWGHSLGRIHFTPRQGILVLR